MAQISNLRLQAKKELLNPPFREHVEASRSSDRQSDSQTDSKSEQPQAYKPFEINKQRLLSDWRYPVEFLHKVLHLYLLRGWVSTFKIEHVIGKMS